MILPHLNFEALHSGTQLGDLEPQFPLWQNGHSQQDCED